MKSGNRRGDVGVSLQKFKKAAKSAMIDPHLGLLAVKQELDNLLKEKEQLSLKVNEAQLSMSKGKLALDFLGRELSGLSQEKLHLIWN